jgi:hypothetical protein
MKGYYNLNNNHFRPELIEMKMGLNFDPDFEVLKSNED